MKHYHVDSLVLVLFIIVSILDFYPNPTWANDKEIGTVDNQALIANFSTKIDKLTNKELIQLGKAYSATNNSAAALKTFQIAFSKNQKNFESKTLIGRELFLNGKERESLLALREALDINPKYEDAYLWIAKHYEKKKNKYELRVLYSDMIDHLGEKLDYVMKLCALNTLSGLHDQAKMYCRRGIVLKKEEPTNYVYLAIVFKETGALPEAKSLMRRAADNFKSSAFAQLTYAQFLSDAHDFLEAVKYFKAATVAEPAAYESWVGLAVASIEIQKYQDSFDAYTTACKLKRSAVSSLRKSIHTLRTLKENDWATKLDLLAESCGPLPGS